MTSSFHILGDGLAGLMLASLLRQHGAEATVYGDSCTNTPPLALVHLFAGRTFRRDLLELTAFQHAVEWWRAEPLAREYPVRRHVPAGDRLHRSMHGLELPEGLAPTQRERDWVEYGPGFVVASQQLERRLRDQVGVVSGAYLPGTLPRPRVLAAGASMPALLPNVEWDRLSGRTVQAVPERVPETILIGMGIHVVPAATADHVLIGGRSSPKGAPQDELELAERLADQAFVEGQAWSGTRCAPARDRRPVLGWSDRVGDSFAFCGFGSRALFWLPLCVQLAVEALLKDQPIPAELDYRRLT